MIISYECVRDLMLMGSEDELRGRKDGITRDVITKDEITRIVIS